METKLLLSLFFCLITTATWDFEGNALYRWSCSKPPTGTQTIGGSPLICDQENARVSAEHSTGQIKDKYMKIQFMSNVE